MRLPGDGATTNRSTVNSGLADSHPQSGSLAAALRLPVARKLVLLDQRAVIL